VKQAVLIFNPRAGNWQTTKLVVAIRSALADAGYEAEPLPTAAPGHATKLARESATAGVEVVFAHGGDGTLREAAAGLLGTDAALAPVPGGTTNVVAFALGLPQNPVRAAKRFSRAEIVDMDVGLCGNEVFLMQTSAGLDAQIMGNLDPWLKRRLGKAAVAISGSRQIFSYDYPAIDLVADGRHLTAKMVALCNLPYYAGSYQMAPGASTSDGELDLVLFTGEGRLETLGFARDLFLGRHLGRSDVDLIRVCEATLLGPPGLPLQVDGDAIPMEFPVTVGLHPRRLKILWPVPE
jgi:diacylglycerol kinase (ATP)